MALVAALVAAAWAVGTQRPKLLSATGYAALSACGLTFVADRDSAASNHDLPDNPFLKLVAVKVDRDERTASAAMFGALFRSTAYAGNGTGCAVATARPDVPAVALPEPDLSQPWPVGDVVEPATPQWAQGLLDTAFGRDEAESSELNTRAVVVVHGGQIVAERYAPGFGPQTPQVGWSLSKSVTAALVGAAERRNVMAPDEANLLPQWDDERADITMWQLVDMTSGLGWEESYGAGSPVTRMLFASPNAAADAAGQPLAHTPGTYQQYSTASPIIVCRVLQDRSGMGPELAREWVFGPLNMRSAVVETDATGTSVCGARVWATPRDWAKFGLWALHEGETGDVVPDGWFDRAKTVPAVSSNKPGKGLTGGWWVNRYPDGSLVEPGYPEDTWWSFGHDGQRIIMIPSADLVIVRQGFSGTELRDNMVAVVQEAVRGVQAAEHPTRANPADAAASAAVVVPSP